MLAPRHMLSGAHIRARLSTAVVRASPALTRPASASANPATSHLDQGFEPWLAAGGSRSASSVAGDSGHLFKAPGAEEADNDGSELAFARREERASPAAILGRNTLGNVVLPQPLVEGVTAAIQECDNPKTVRQAYLHLLEPTKEKERVLRNTYDHALARAAAFLPTQYAALRNVIGELNRRVGGGLVGPTLELSGTLGAGLWATYDVLGPDALRGYTFVNRTRHGLALAERLADAIPVEKQFKRELTFVEMDKPEVAISSFILSDLPKKIGRIDHLNKLLSVGSEHIVIVERAGDEGWALMKEAREYLLRQSTAEDPLHIMAPCAQDGACPRSEGKEACAFGQKLQRPPFLRKTKHGKRGDEIMTYTYLILSRGPRPEAPETDEPVGRLGAVGREELARIQAKDSGRTVQLDVEGGERGVPEAVDVPVRARPMIKPKVKDEDNPFVQAQLRREAYSWPRIIAPVMKRSGHVVVDTCTAEGELVRARVAKSHGKQDYYDARRLGWGDLYPHEFRGSTELRTRGIRRLTKYDPGAADDELEEIVRKIHRDPVEHDEEVDINLPELDENVTLTRASRPQAVEDSNDVFTGDPELDALIKRYGGKDFRAKLVPDAEAKTKGGENRSVLEVSNARTWRGKRQFSTSARRMAAEEDIDDECAVGEGGFSMSSLSEPDDRRPVDKAYSTSRPKRPEPAAAPAAADAEPAAVGEGGWSRWSLSDPPLRSDKDVEFYFSEDPDQDCAPGEDSFSRSSLGEPDYERPIDKKPYESPRPKRPDHPIVVESANGEPAAAGEGGFSRWSLSEPPYRTEKRSFSTVACGLGSKRSFATFAARRRIPLATVPMSRAMSVAPAERQTSAASRPKLNVGSLHSIYASGTPITVLTAYDYPTALLSARAGVDIILVGDSLAQVALGYPTTVPLTLDEMAHHVRAVARGSGSAFVLADVPFGYAEASVADGVRAAVTLIKAGADGVKIEGGREMLPLVRRLSETGVAVMAHIGLQPQRVASMGYKAQARKASAAADLVATAKACEEAGAFGLLLEAIPHPVAKAITEQTSIPSIGIGAGNACSGQVLVVTDMLATYDLAAPGEGPAAAGASSFKVPKFVRLFGNVGQESRRAVDAYVAAVRSRDFPATGKETYAMPKEQAEEFAKMIDN